MHSGVYEKEKLINEKLWVEMGSAGWILTQVLTYAAFAKMLYIYKYERERGLPVLNIEIAEVSSIFFVHCEHVYFIKCRGICIITP